MERKIVTATLIFLIFISTLVLACSVYAIIYNIDLVLPKLTTIQTVIIIGASLTGTIIYAQYILSNHKEQQPQKPAPKAQRETAPNQTYKKTIEKLEAENRNLATMLRLQPDKPKVKKQNGPKTKLKN